MSTRRALALAAALVASALVASVVQPTASAAPPAPVSLQLFVSTFCCPEVGTWHATGAIDDSGAFVRTDGNGTGSIPECFCEPTHTGAFQEEFTLTGSRGTLVVSAQHLLTPTGGLFGATNGVWEIRGGTGAYAAASGHGTDEFLPPTLSLLLRGVVSKA